MKVGALMSSKGAVPVAPPPPPPLPPNKVGKGIYDLHDSGQVSGSKSGQGENEDNREGISPLGHTETRVITEEKFLSEVIELLSSRLVETSDGDRIKVAITVPLEKAILQNGPMCGIVALAEALQLINPNKELTPAKILDEGIQRSYTKQGEMFSVTNVMNLAKKFGDLNDAEVLDSRDPEHLKKFISHLAGGWPVLIPYDADYNHSPSLRKGHAAHWAVIYGLAFYIPNESQTLLLNESFKILQSSQSTLIVRPLLTSSTKHIEALLPLLKFETLHVIAHQGKSFHTALWKLKDLIESNQNLLEISPKILENKLDYICDNIDGLCSKILLIK